MASKSIDIVISTILKKTGIDAARAALTSLAGKVKDFSKSVATNLAHVKAGFDMVAGVARSFSGVFTKAIKAAFDFESSKTAFAGLLNSVDKSKKHIEDLQKFASRTPLTFGDLQGASKLLLSFGMEVNDIMPSLKMLGDISMGNAQKFQGLALVFAQVKSAGKLMGQDLLQMINQGFNPLTIISQKTGKSMTELKDVMSKGGISFEMVAEAMRIATSEGGLFNNAMEDASKTGNGLISTLQDNWVDALRTFGTELMDVAKGGIQWCINKIHELKESGAIQEWAQTAKEAIYSVVGAFKGLSDSGTRGDVWSALKDVVVGGFEEAATSAGKILLKAGGALGDLLVSKVKGLWSASDNEKQAENEVTAQFKAEGKGGKLWGINSKYKDEYNAAVKKRLAELDAASSDKTVKDIFGGGELSGSDRVARGLNALKAFGKKAFKDIDEEAKQIKIKEENSGAAISTAVKANPEVLNQIAAPAVEEVVKKSVEAEERERKRMEAALHKQRVDDAKAELEVVKNAAEQKQNAISAAQSEFDRAFAMYRSEDKGAAAIEEERKYAEDYKQLKKDAARYGGASRAGTSKIDELSSLIAAGDTQGQQAKLEEWRKSSKFTPEVESMVRAAAADNAKTTAEDELRKLNATMDEHNAKLDQLLTMKGGE